MSKWIFGISILVLSCTQKSECNLAETIFYEKNQPYVEVFTLAQLMEMQDSTKARLCDPDYFWSDLKVGNLYIPAEIYPKQNCKRINFIGCRFGSPKTELKVINANQVELNDSLVNSSDLDSLFQIHFSKLDISDYKEWQKSIVIFKWDDTVQVNVLEETLQQAINGYVKFLDYKYKRIGQPFDCQVFQARVDSTHIPNEEDILKFGVPVIHPFSLWIYLNDYEK